MNIIIPFPSSAKLFLYMDTLQQQNLFRKFDKKFTHAENNPLLRVGTITFMAYGFIILPIAFLILFSIFLRPWNPTDYYYFVLFMGLFILIGIFLLRNIRKIQDSPNSLVAPAFLLTSIFMYILAVSNLLIEQDIGSTIFMALFGSFFLVFSILIHKWFPDSPIESIEAIDFLPMHELQEKAIKELNDPDSLYLIKTDQNRIMIRMKYPMDLNTGNIHVLKSEVLYEHVVYLNEKKKTFEPLDIAFYAQTEIGPISSLSLSIRSGVVQEAYTIITSNEKQTVFDTGEASRLLNHFCMEHGYRMN